MKKVKSRQYFEADDCLECPFCSKPDKWGAADCELYEKAIVARAEKKPDFCQLIRIIVETAD